MIDEDHGPSWNVAPTQHAPAIVDVRDEDGGDARRQLRSMRWGLVPHWVKDLAAQEKRGPMINTRVNALATKPALLQAAGMRRLVVPADGYYEWLDVEYPDGTRDKEAYYIRRADGRAMSFAGLYELWVEYDDADPVWSYAIITATARGDVGEVHDRTPYLLPDDKIDTWLDPSMENARAAQDLLRSLPPIEVAIRQVSRRVGKVRNNDASLIEPIIDEPDRQEILIPT